MKKLISIKYFLFLLCFYSSVLSQNSIIDPAGESEFKFERFSTEDGMSSTYVITIAQDQEGFIWFGTMDGLIKYDGYQYLAYRNIPYDTTSLNDNRIEKIFVDHTGILWVGTNAGLNRFESSRNSFVRYYPEPSNSNSLTQGQINSIIEDQSKNLWIGTQDGGLFRYERDNDRFTRFLSDPEHPNTLINDQVRILLADKNNFLWIGTGEPFDPAVKGGGLIRLDLSTEATKRFRHDSENPKSLIDDRVSALLEDRDGVLWVGTCRSGLHYYNPLNEEFIRMMPDPENPNLLHAPQGDMGLWSSCPHVRILHQDKKGAFWIGTFNGGINYFAPATNKMSYYAHDSNDPNSLANNMIFSILEDRQERIWIGNLLAGYHKIEPSLHKFTTYVNNPIDPNSLSLNNVMGIYEAPKEKGIIWLSSRGGGLNQLDLETGRFTTFQHNPENKNSISSDIVWTTYEDRTGAFWVGTEEGLDLLDRRTGKFNHHKLKVNDTESSVVNPVVSLYEDRQNNLWIGTWSGGVFRFDRKKGIYKQYDFSDGKHAAYFNSIFLIHEDTKGTIWVGSWMGGLYKYDRQSDTFNPNLQGYGALCLQEDNEGWFWLGTQKDGLIHIDPLNNSIERYTVADGLPSNSIYGILKDAQGFFWISTTKGISKFNPKLKTFSNYDISDGLLANSFNTNSALKSSSGKMFFGGNEGLVSFFPNRVKNNPYPPDVTICGLRIGNKSTDILDTKSKKLGIVQLEHNQNDLTFEYVGLHYTDPSQNKYSYILEPYDPNWVDAGTQRTARYTNLDPGEYNFKVKASNSDGVWSEEGKTISIIISSPWWLTWWANTIYLLVTIVAVYGIRKYELNRIRLKNQLKLESVTSKKLRELDQVKSRFFANISHEFRTPLTLILGQIGNTLSNNLDSKIKSNLEVANRNGQRLLQLINQLLDLSKIESGSMSLKSKRTDIVLFIKNIFYSFESLAKQKEITYNYNCDFYRFEFDFDMRKLEKVFFNLLSNAFKFTPVGGKIEVTIKHFLNSTTTNSTKVDKKTGIIEIQVADNGSGVSAENIPHLFDRFYQVDNSSTREHQGTGIGLALSKELVELHGGKISVASEVGAGSTFIVQLPFEDCKIVYDKPKKTEPELSEETTGHEKIMEVSLTVDDKGLSSAKINNIKNNGKEIILVVEDNIDVRNYIVEQLISDFQIFEAEDGEEGISLAKTHTPDLIITDVMMPKIDGCQLTTELKLDEKTSHIPIIMLTAKAAIDNKIEGFEIGADDYILKPFNSEELLVRVKNLISTRRQLRRKFRKATIIKPSDVTAVSMDQRFLQKVLNVVDKCFEDEQFGVDKLAEEANMSVSQLNRKLRALIDQSAGQLIRSMRLQRAADLLKKESGTIAEICYQVGFNDQTSFTRAFKKQFGDPPSKYKVRQKQK